MAAKNPTVGELINGALSTFLKGKLIHITQHKTAHMVLPMCAVL